MRITPENLHTHFRANRNLPVTTKETKTPAGKDQIREMQARFEDISEADGGPQDHLPKAPGLVSRYGGHSPRTSEHEEITMYTGTKENGTLDVHRRAPESPGSNFQVREQSILSEDSVTTLTTYHEGGSSEFSAHFKVATPDSIKEAYLSSEDDLGWVLA